MIISGTEDQEEKGKAHRVHLFKRYGIFTYFLRNITFDKAEKAAPMKRSLSMSLSAASLLDPTLDGNLKLN
jgi:hypothetical protein